MDSRTHWAQVYQTKAPTQVSWYQEHPDLSLEYIQRTGVDQTARIMDAGGGASTLVNHLLEAGYHNLTVLDISAEALQVVRQRLGPRAGRVTLIEADVTQAELPHQFYDVWHDRAVFHFLTQPEARQRYVELVRHAVKVGGHVIVATFALDGPTSCSGLTVERYSPETLHNQFGPAFTLVDSTHESHATPFGTEQKFTYCYCRILD